MSFLKKSIKIKNIIISSIIAIGCSYLFVTFGSKSIGFYSDKETTFFKNYILTDEKIKMRFGNITNIHNELIGSEKETVEGTQKGIYHFKLDALKRTYTIKFEWYKDNKDSICISEYSIIDSTK